MSERWKPSYSEPYWIIAFSEVVRSVWTADRADLSRWQMGNCFKTKEEAVTALKKFTDLLLSLHDNDENLQENIQDMVTNTCQAMDKSKENVEKATCTFGNLPKLSTEVFNRPDCPKWAKWAAVDECGCVRLFSDSPWLGKSCWNWSKGEVKYLLGVKFDASDWQKSRIKRPKKNTLPEWCKPGEWVWETTFNTYFKVDEVDALFIGGKGLFGNDYSVKIKNVRQARLRPYNAEEMRGMVGKVIDSPCSSRLVTAYNEGGCIKILTSIGWYAADDLMTSDYTIDGKPCGVLEHLNENGEWVE